MLRRRGARSPRTAVAYGTAVALSADGNTLIVGGHGAWVYTRAGSTWAEQQKLSATNDPTNSLGTAVALSADGQTAIASGAGVGVWVWVHGDAGWTEQQMLVTPADAVPPGAPFTNPGFGVALALSADATALLIGGDRDSNRGAVWALTQSAGTWSEQQKIAAPAEAVGPSGFGRVLAVSADGNVALTTGNDGPPARAAVWAFGRTGSTWAQEARFSSAPGPTFTLVGPGTRCPPMDRGHSSAAARPRSPTASGRSRAAGRRGGSSHSSNCRRRPA